MILPFGYLGDFHETVKPFCFVAVLISRGGLPGPRIFTSVLFSSDPKFIFALFLRNIIVCV